MLTITDLPNLMGWLFCVMPAVFFVYIAWLSRGEPWRYSVLISGIALILIGIYMFGMFNDLLVYLENMKELGKIKTQADTNIYAQLKTSGAIWLVALPPVIGGIGVNLLSEFILARKPSST
jgi:hypothetical protein